MDEINKTMKEHFRDDKDSFAKINELLIINGDHMSTFRRDLTVIMNTLKLQDEASHDFRKDDSDFRKRIEPMIASYEQDVAAVKSAKRWGLRLVGLAAVIASWLAVKDFVKEFIINNFTK